MNIETADPATTEKPSRGGAGVRTNRLEIPRDSDGPGIFAIVLAGLFVAWPLLKLIAIVVIVLAIARWMGFGG